MSLSRPSRDLAERLMTEVGWEDRLRADWYNPMAGATPYFCYSLAEAASFLGGDEESLADRRSGSARIISPPDLMIWVRDKLGDEELARAIGERVKELDACQDPIARQRTEVTLIEPLKALLLARVQQCREVLAE